MALTAASTSRVNENMAKNKEYYKGNILGFTAFIAHAFKLDINLLRYQLQKQFPALADKSRCPHCNANMEMKVYTANLNVALLLLAMAAQVRENIRKGMSFTEANRVHVPTLAVSDATRHAVTMASYVNLVKQPPQWAQSGHWVITNWGYKALRGEKIPKKAKYFRGELIERSEEMTDLPTMFKTHREKVEAAIARGKAVASDYRADLRSYDPIEWTEYGGQAVGSLFE